MPIGKSTHVTGSTASWPPATGPRWRNGVKTCAVLRSRSHAGVDSDSNRVKVKLMSRFPYGKSTLCPPHALPLLTELHAAADSTWYCNGLQRGRIEKECAEYCRIRENKNLVIPETHERLEVCDRLTRQRCSSAARCRLIISWSSRYTASSIWVNDESLAR